MVLFLSFIHIVPIIIKDRFFLFFFRSIAALWIYSFNQALRSGLLYTPLTRKRDESGGGGGEIKRARARAAVNIEGGFDFMYTHSVWGET